MDSGWVADHRKVKYWEWYKTPHMYHLFSHLIREANICDAKWRGIEIKRGQLVTGRKKLSEDTGISEQSIRTCLNRLKSTNEITIKPTSKYSIITICNYDSYQLGSGETNQQTNQQTNHQLTNNQPHNNKKNKDNKIENSCVDDFEKFRKKYPGTTRGLETEWQNFKKKNKDWQTVTPNLINELNRQIKEKEAKAKHEGFVPQWKHLQTYLNNRGWEESYPITNGKQQPQIVQTSKGMKR